MPKDDRDILEVLKSQLDFVEKGGYRRSVRTPWKPTSIFEDSLTCINFGDPKHSRPCEECLLMEFVPMAARSGSAPCHRIPLNKAGQTVERFELEGDQDELEEAVRRWLKNNIAQIESARARSAAFSNAGERPQSSRPTGRKRVLVVDDDERVLMSLERLLEDEGYDTTMAWGGREALGLLGESSFDLVLLDDHLPDATSEEILKQLNRVQGRTPVLVMQTSSLADERAAQLARQGACYFVSKQPLDHVATLAHDYLARAKALAGYA